MSDVRKRDLPVTDDVYAGSAGGSDDRPAPADAPATNAGAGLQVNTTSTLAVVALDAALLAATARIGALALLIGIAVTQAVLTLSWVFGTTLPGRRGALVLAALAAAGADVAVSVRPHAGLGALLPLIGLAVPAMFIHQLVRGAARVRLLESVGLIGVLLVAVIGVSALQQLWHEFGDPATSGRVVSAVILAIGAGLVGELVIDLVAPVPHFDAKVQRGLLGVLGRSRFGGSRRLPHVAPGHSVRRRPQPVRRGRTRRTRGAARRRGVLRRTLHSDSVPWFRASRAPGAGRAGPAGLGQPSRSGDLPRDPHVIGGKQAAAQSPNIRRLGCRREHRGAHPRHPRANAGAHVAHLPPHGRPVPCGQLPVSHRLTG